MDFPQWRLQTPFRLHLASVKLCFKFTNTACVCIQQCMNIVYVTYCMRLCCYVGAGVLPCWSSCDKISICLDPLTQKDCQHRHSSEYKYHQSHLLHLLVPPCNATLFGFSSVALQLRAVALARLFLIVSQWCCWGFALFIHWYQLLIVHSV